MSNPRGYHMYFATANSKEEAENLVNYYNSIATPYMRKHYPAHYTETSWGNALAVFYWERN